MNNLITLLVTLMPMLMPLIQALLVKPKTDAAQWARDGAKAHLSGAVKDPVAAFWLGSLACAIDSMTPADWETQKTAVPAALKAFQTFGAAMQKGGAA